VAARVTENRRLGRLESRSWHPVRNAFAAGDFSPVWDLAVGVVWRHLIRAEIDRCDAGGPAPPTVPLGGS
jgi:hypothetical protein